MHIAVFERKLASLVKFLMHKQVWKFQPVFSNFAGMD